MIRWTIPLVALLLVAAAPVRTVDRIVAVVDEDPILLSDLERVLELGLVERDDGEAEEALRRRVLDRLVVERLRHHAVDREVAPAVAEAEVDRQVDAVRDAWRRSAGAAETFDAWLEERALDPTELRRLLRRQLRILAYIEERLGPRVFVDLEEIRAYYESELSPGLEAEGRKVPPLAEIREDIRALLRQRRLDREVEEWTERLRAEADVVDLLDPPDALPPVRTVLEAPPPID